MIAQENLTTRLHTESRLKEMKEENEILLLQLHQAQEELEHYYQQRQIAGQERSSGAHGNITPAANWIDDGLLDALAENQRLRALVHAQRKVYRLESENALNIKLGNLLIQGVDSPKTLLSIPGALGKIWRSYRRQLPPATLGGKAFTKVIAAYGDGGFDAVEKLMADRSVSPTVRASGYTVLGRHLMNCDRISAAEAARRAYALEPKAFRLKWLAFRLHEAGMLVEAEAMLDILPSDTKFSDSEARQASQLRHEAKHARQREAKEVAGFSERRAEIERQLSSLARARDESAQLLAERTREVEALTQTNALLLEEKSAMAGHREEAARHVNALDLEVAALRQANVHLEREKAALAVRYEEAARQAAERAREVETLKQVEARMRQECAVLVEQHERKVAHVAELYQDVTALTQAKSQLEEELLAAIAMHEEVIEQLVACSQEVQAMKQAWAQLEQEKLVASARHEEVCAQMLERTRRVEMLEQVNAQLELEKTRLARRLESAADQAVERARELEELRQANAQSELARQTLAALHEDAIKLEAERKGEIEQLQLAKKQLEIEKSTLLNQHGESSRLVADHAEQINALQRQLANQQARDTESKARQMQVQEEMVRAEAQLELIKDILLREPEL
ncbi:hypothetical protein QZN06_24445 [Burkholderia multivorans]|nr:hypothetical protein [Burkholderia multivorans]